MMVTVFLAVYGKQGLRELGEHNLAKAAFLRSALIEAGAKALFNGVPCFNEFVLSIEGGAEAANTALLDQKIIGGLPLAKWYPELGPDASLWCATELTTRPEMDHAAEALAVVTQHEMAAAH